jgi:hypothetical protein
MAKRKSSSKNNQFHNLNKKILELSTFTTEHKPNHTVTFYLECLGFTEKFSTSIGMEGEHFGKFIEKHLCSRLVENSEFMKKFEQFQNRDSNLRTLLD